MRSNEESVNHNEDPAQPKTNKSFLKITKSITFMCINNKHVKTKIKNIIPFTVDLKKMKCLGITQQTIQNYKILMKEIKEDQDKWRCLHGCRLEDSKK